MKRLGFWQFILIYILAIVWFIIAQINFTPAICIRTEAKSESVLIRIADNGTGISDDVKTRIFDPFFTTKPVGSGTGLGLSISYSIVVEKHGGQLTCTSTPQGTEFVIKIPQ